MFKKLVVHIIINFLLFGALAGVYIQLPQSYQSIDNRLRDFFFINRGTKQDSQTIRIVTIDEASLKELGQWPWERFKISQMLENLSAAGAAVIGLDVFFSEVDKSSPRYVIKSLNKKEELYPLENLPDYDDVLTKSISQTPTVLGYIFDLQDERNINQFPMISASITEKNFKGTNFLPVAKGVTLNLEQFQDNALSSGFLNTIPDESGIIRRVPLVIKYQEMVFTSLSLEIYRLISAVENIDINYVATGVSSLDLIQNETTTSIPTDRYGRLFLNFLGPRNSFTYISAIDVINNTFDPALVKGKIVLFGATAVGLLDLRASPFDNALPGIEIHATAIENMLHHDFLHNPDWAEGATVLMLFLIALILTIAYSSLSAYYIVPVMTLALYGLYLLFNYLLFQQGLILNILFPFAAVILFTISSTLMNYLHENHLRRIIRDSFSKKVSSSVVDEILKNKSTDVFIAHEKEISIFFSDIRGFTNISEQLASPTKLIDILNMYMTPMVDSIIEKKGTVDKFIGDAIMAYWNAPNHVENHADASIQSAIQQIARLKEVNKEIKQKYQLTIDIGIGINTGIATVGEMGSSGRSDYTIIGDSVNLASRLEGLCKPYGCKIIISESTLQQAKQDYVIRKLDKVRVKGKKEPISIFEVLAEGKPQGELVEELQDYELALAAYLKAEFQDAKVLFDHLVNSHENNTLYSLYSERSQFYIENPPSEFDGVFTFTTK